MFTPGAHGSQVEMESPGNGVTTWVLGIKLGFCAGPASAHTVEPSLHGKHVLTGVREYAVNCFVLSTVP